MSYRPSLVSLMLFNEANQVVRLSAADELGVGVPATLANQSLLYTAVIPGLQGNTINIALTNTTTAGSEVATVAGVNITVSIQNGVSTTSQVRTALLANGAAVALITPSLTGNGTETVTGIGASFLTGGSIQSNQTPSYIYTEGLNSTSIFATDVHATQIESGNQGTEKTSLILAGVTQSPVIRLSSIATDKNVSMIFHKHSTTTEPILLACRSNSDTSAHTNVTASQILFTLKAAGWASTNYKPFAAIQFGVSSSGSISSTSAPGKIEFLTTPNGSLVPTVATTIDQDKSVHCAGVICPDGAQSTINGSVSGTIVCSQPIAGTSYKSVLIYCNALNGTASYTFPTAFVQVPQILSQTLAALVTTLNTTTVTITGTTSTGFINLLGY